MDVTAATQTHSFSIKQSETPLRGPHNALNMLAAILAALIGQGPMADAAMLAAAKTASLTAPPPSLVAKLLPFAPVAAGVILWPAIGVIGPVLGAIGTGLWFWEDRQT